MINYLAKLSLDYDEFPIFKFYKMLAESKTQ